MIDLIGFWFVVTVFTVTLALPCVYLLGVFLRQAARNAMPIEAADKFMSYICKWVPYDGVELEYNYFDHKGRKIGEREYARDKERYPNLHNDYKKIVISKQELILFNKIKVNDDMIGGATIAGVILWVVYVVVGGINYLCQLASEVANPAWLSLLYSVSWLSTKAAPLAGYIGILVGVYFGLIALLKVLYKASVFVSSVNAHMNDGSKHSEGSKD